MSNTQGWTQNVVTSRITRKGYRGSPLLPRSSSSLLLPESIVFLLAKSSVFSLARPIIFLLAGSIIFLLPESIVFLLGGSESKLSESGSIGGSVGRRERATERSFVVCTLKAGISSSLLLSLFAAVAVEVDELLLLESMGGLAGLSLSVICDAWRVYEP